MTPRPRPAARLPEPGEPLPDGYVWAADGLPARDQGDWAQQKLQFLGNYQGPALGATKRKRGQTYYIDLFAGPGLNVSIDSETGRRQEFSGSPVRALNVIFPGRGAPTRFGGYHFCNLDDVDHLALSERVRRELKRLDGAVAPEVVRCHPGDANLLLPKILATIPDYAYLLVFADIEGPKDLPFSTIRLLRHPHSSVDLYVLYPSGIGLNRPLAYEEEAARPVFPTYDAYFGLEAWREIWRARKTDAQTPAMQRGLFALYCNQLRTLWRHVEVVATPMKAGRRMYKMLFAYDHDAAGSIAKSAAGKAEQREFF